MVTEDIVHIISEQTQILYLNVEAILDGLIETDLNDNNICDWPLGEQIYHMLQSMDQWFINPNRYKESEQYSKNNMTMFELIGYCQSIKNKIVNYLDHLDPDSLIEKPPDCEFSKLALILGQYRHFMYHIGLVHGCLRVHTQGTSPPYFGLGPPIKPII